MNKKTFLIKKGVLWLKEIQWTDENILSLYFLMFSKNAYTYKYKENNNLLSINFKYQY